MEASWKFISKLLGSGPWSSKLLGGSWVVMHGDIVRVAILITHIRALIPPLITTLNPNP